MKPTGAQVVKFIEKHLRHPEGPWEGKPFTLLPFQRQIIHDIYDERDSQGRRVCRQFWYESPKGNGKSPLITAIGLAELLFGGPGAYVLSAAATWKQANETTFGYARQLVLKSPTLAQFFEVQEKMIRSTDGSNRRWEVMTADARRGKAGPRPTCVLLDEAQEQPDRKLLDMIEANQRKLSHREPLLLVASNAGKPGTIAHIWHERGLRYMRGDKGKDLAGFKARVYGLDHKADWRDESLWAAANPALGKIITMADLRKERDRALTDPGTEFRFRTLHLGQWVSSSATGFIDMDRWHAATSDLPPDEVLATMPCWVSLDMSTLDDLTAVAAVWVGPDRRLYVRTWQWVPRATAEGYEDSHGIPYTAWAEGGHVTLTDPPTIDHTIKAEIVAHITGLADTYDVQQVCYDPHRAPEIVQALERTGLICEPIKQNTEHLSAPTKDLAARLAAGTITLDPNPCVAWQAANLHVVANTFGDIRPAKQHAAGKFAGTVHMKIDSLSAIITAMSRASRYANKLVEGDASDEPAPAAVLYF